jgi:hypothetical protein
MIYFCKRSIEWTAAEAEPQVAGELVDIQRIVAAWRRAWPEAQNSPTQRTLLSVQAKKWADQVLDFSGINLAPSQPPG